ILVIEDDPDIVELLRYNLERESYRVTSAATGAEGWAQLERERPDLLILDLMLPEISGFDLCRRLRRDSEYQSLPVIMLTARSEEADVIAGIELGADDYITKPFSPRELVARVGRTEQPAPSPDEGALQFGDLVIDPTSHEVRRGGDDLPVTHLEFKLLHYLASHPQRVFSREQLLDRVWGHEKYITLRSVDVYVRRLRQKVDVSGNSSLLKTVRGAGYRFEPPP
ncbi:Phosphate regulon transcriptional regulatory protein PhoB, partial [Geodia barretti]